MGKLPISQLIPGQRVARQVVTPSHVTLMQPGIELTAALIDRLRDLGVQEVWVEDPPEGSAVRPPTLGEQLAALERRFSDHQSNPLMLELKAVIARQFVQEHEHHAGDRPGIRPCFRSFDERLKPERLDLGVVMEQRDVASSRQGPAAIVSTCHTQIGRGTRHQGA